MLNGIDPIMIFNFSKLTPSIQDSLAKIPLTAGISSKVKLPPIPVYLSRSLTGLIINNEEKSLVIETKVDTPTASDKKTDISQKGIENTISINMQAKKDGIGITLISALADVVFGKVSSADYSITYIHGPITVFDGLLHSFKLSQSPETDLIDINFELAKTGEGTVIKGPVLEVINTRAAIPGGS